MVIESGETWRESVKMLKMPYRQEERETDEKD